MADISLRVDEGGLNAMKKYISGLVKGPGSLKRLHRHASWKFAKHVEGKVREAYIKSNFPVSEGTVEAYRRPPQGSRGYRATSSLKRSGTLQRSVVTRRNGNAGWLVQIDPSKTYPNGTPVQVVAHRQEVGYIQRMIMTPERLAYLHILRPGNQELVKEGDNVPVIVQAHPVWEPTFRKLRSWKGVYYDAVNAWLREKKSRQVPGV